MSIHLTSLAFSSDYRSEVLTEHTTLGGGGIGILRSGSHGVRA